MTTQVTWQEKVSTFIKSKTFNVGIVAALTVAVLILIAYGISSHKEPGYMATTPQWERSDFPLQVCAVAYADRLVCDPASMVCDDAGNNLSCDAYATVTDAINTTNSRLGFKALEIASTSCDITDTVGVPVEHGFTEPGGNALISAHSCQIQTANVHGEVRDLVMEHELGHCIGLDHDFYQQSIMRRAQIETPMGELPPWISDSDRALLRQDFGPLSE